MWPMKKRSSDGVERGPQVDETEMTPAPEALRHAAKRALARLSGRGRRRAAEQLDGQVVGHGAGPSNQSAEEAAGAALGDDPALWARAHEPGKREDSAERHAAGSLRRLADGFVFVFGRLTGRA